MAMMVFKFQTSNGYQERKKTNIPRFHAPNDCFVPADESVSVSANVCHALGIINHMKLLKPKLAGAVAESSSFSSFKHSRVTFQTFNSLEISYVPLRWISQI